MHPVMANIWDELLENNNDGCGHWSNPCPTPEPSPFTPEVVAGLIVLSGVVVLVVALVGMWVWKRTR